MLLVCPHSLECCNPIPKKSFFSLGMYVPWCPRVNHGCSKPIKCCSGVPSKPDCQPAFSLSTPPSLPNKDSVSAERFNTQAKTLRGQLQPPVDDLCYLTLLYKSRNTVCFKPFFIQFFWNCLLLMATHLIKQILYFEWKRKLTKQCYCYLNLMYFP